MILLWTPCRAYSDTLFGSYMAQWFERFYNWVSRITYRTGSRGGGFKWLCRSPSARPPFHLALASPSPSRPLPPLWAWSRSLRPWSCPEIDRVRRALRYLRHPRSSLALCSRCTLGTASCGFVHRRRNLRKAGRSLDRDNAMVMK